MVVQSRVFHGVRRTNVEARTGRFSRYSYETQSCGTDNGANEMTPDELIEVLKRYQRESNQSDLILASRIGVNHHTVNRWLKDAQCPTKGPLALAAAFLRPRRLLVGVSPLGVSAKKA